MSLTDMLLGYTKYTLVTEDGENVINSLKERLLIKSIKLEGDKLEFACSYCDARLADNALIDAGISDFSKSSHGITYMLYRYKKRCGLFVGAIIILFLLFISMLFVWEIRVEGNETVRDDEIITLLKEAGFCEGVLKSSVKKESVINKCLIADDRISWMSINYEGTVAHVELKEARIVKKIEKKQNVNLVASFNGIIHRIDALSGTAEAAEGDAVTKGQLLISSFVDKRTGGSSLRGAKGFAWAYTERGYRVCVPLEYKEKQYSGSKNSSYRFSILGRSMNFGRVKTKFLQSEYETITGKIRLTSNTYLPINVKTRVFSEYEPTIKRRSEKEARELAMKIAEQRLSEDAVSFTLVSIDKSFSVENDVLILDCVFKGIEDIARELEFNLDI